MGVNLNTVESEAGRVNDPLEFNNQVALITGSSRGIGSTLVRRFAALGAQVIINYRSSGSSANNARDLAQDIEAGGGRALVIQADISIREEIIRLMETIKQEFGRVDHLILNAARAVFKPLDRILERELHQVVENNFTGQILTIKEALPLFPERGGKIVFLSSLGSRLYTPAYPLGLMKAAMESAVRHYSVVLHPRRININAVCGGIVKTDSFKVLRQYWEKIDALPEALCVTPEEIADTVLFLCSSMAAGIRGQTIVVDRGLSNMLYI